MRGRRLCALATDRRGVAALEFAILAPLFLMLLFGTAAYALYLASWIGVVQAAAEGARAAVAGMDDAERRTLAAGRAQAVLGGYAPLMDPGRAIIEYPAAAAGIFTVRVAYPVESLGLARIAAFAPPPSVSPSGTSTVTVGGL